MTSFLSILESYFKKRLILILLLGFSSGLPLLLTLSTLSFWLASVGIDKTSIGLFALVGFPYAWKFLWAPAVDHIRLPFLHKKFGQRRSWLLLTQVFLTLSIIAMGYSNPAHNILLTVLSAFVLAFFSATQDIIIDAYRIESLPTEEYALGGSYEIFGYRLGMIFAGGVAIMLSDLYSWQTVYLIMACFMAVGILTTLICPEPKVYVQKKHLTSSFIKRVEHALVAPFFDFMKHQGWPLILAFILLYRLGDNVIGQMSVVFYKELGFTGTEIGLISKTFGIWATIMGAMLGGGIALRFGIVNTLLYGGLSHILSNSFLILLSYKGHSLPMLYITILSENVSAGVMTAAFVAFLSQLCSKQFTATQYALFSSLMAITRIGVQSLSGLFAEVFGWVELFLAASALALPSLILLIFFRKTFQQTSHAS